MKTIKAILFIALLALPGFIEAQQQVIIVPQNNTLYNANTTDPLVGWVNSNIQRGARIHDELTIRHLSPPVKVEQKVIIEQKPAQQFVPLRDYMPQTSNAPDYGVFNGYVK